MDRRRLTLLAASAVAAGFSPTAGAGADAHGTYLIVHPPYLAAAARDWADYRASHGWRVSTLELAADGDEAMTRVNLRSDIRELAASRPSGGLMVLLLGDAEARGIPTWHFEQRDRTLRSPSDAEYVSDHPYQVLDDGGSRPEIPLGRIPARTNDDAAIVLDKIKAYEHGDHLGAWRRRIAYAAGEGRFGPADRLLEGLFAAMVGRLVPDEFDVSMTYAKGSSIYCPPPSQLTETVLSQLGDGALLFNYIGHGTAFGFDDLYWNGERVSIMQRDDLRKLQDRHHRLPIAVLTCCSAGWYDLPHGELSLGEAMLFHPAGPVAVIAGSRPTHPYANVILQKDLTRLLLIEQVETAGELDLRAMQSMLEIDAADRQLDIIAAPIARIGAWPSTLGGLRRMHVRLYNLLGDPALRIALPRRRLDHLAVAGRRIEGRIDGMVTGTVTITIETERTAPLQSRALRPVDGPDDPDLEAKAAHNYPIANDVVLAGLDAPVVAGRFEATLAADPPAQAAIVKAYAVGTDDAGREIDAIGAVRVNKNGILFNPNSPAPPADPPRRPRNRR